MLIGHAGVLVADRRHLAVWPYTIPNDDEQKRRLLYSGYSAITRAQRSCLVLVQAEELLNAPPFVAWAEFS
jgi:hypothetical protein